MEPGKVKGGRQNIAFFLTNPCIILFISLQTTLRELESVLYKLSHMMIPTRYGHTSNEEKMHKIVFNKVIFPY